MSMPADNVHGLGSETYLNIIAFLLRSNGLPPGNSDLNANINVMKKMILSPKSKIADKTSSLERSGVDTYYTQAQADRGKAYFHGSCSLCHTTDPSEVRSNDASSGR